MFYFCGLNYLAVPPYVVPVHNQCIQSGLRRCANTDEDLTLNLLVKGFRATMTHIQILPSGKAPAFPPVLDATDVLPASGTFSQTII